MDNNNKPGRNSGTNKWKDLLGPTPNSGGAPKSNQLMSRYQPKTFKNHEKLLTKFGPKFGSTLFQPQQHHYQVDDHCNRNHFPVLLDKSEQIK